MIIMVVAITTFLTRALPFIIFKDPKKTPDLIIYLSKVLPYSIMAMLVVYCLKDMNFFNKKHIKKTDAMIFSAAACNRIL